MQRQNLILGSALAVTLIVGGGAMAIHTLANPERILQQAQQKARERWGKELTVGALEVDVFPRPVVHARDVKLEGVGEAQRFEATMQVFPLLFGRVRPASFVVEGGTFSDPKGRDWRVDRATFDSDLDWRSVKIDATISRNGQTAHATGRFADLSRIGHRGQRSRGKVEIEWGETRIAAEGDFSLDGMRGHAVKASMRTGSLDDVFAFVGVDRARTAPLEATADIRDDGELVHIDNVQLHLGGMHATGAATVSTKGDKPTLDGKINADRFDWRQALEDMGHAKKPNGPSQFVFRDKPLAWKSFTHLRGLRGKVEATAQWARLGNGIELQQPRANFTFDDDRVVLDIWQAKLLGGTGRGSMRFDGTMKTIRFEASGENLLLQRWFHERGRDHQFTGGPMQVRMALDMRGDTWRSLAATVTGPFSMRMGHGSYDRQKASEWEALMAVFSKKESTGAIELECAAANLRFENGVARGDSIVGARSTLSSLLTSGEIDMREEHVDLRGKLHPLDGQVGLAAIAGDLQIEGPLRKLHVQLDPAKKPAVVGRALAAVATLGLSVAATGKADTARDACAIVPASPAKRGAQASTASVRP
jgi:AsmA family protein